MSKLISKLESDSLLSSSSKTRAMLTKLYCVITAGVIRCILTTCLVISILLLTKPSSYAEPCIAAYAIQHSTWDCDKFLLKLRGIKDLRVSFLWHSFGESKDCLTRLLKKKTLTLISVHLINYTCVRNRNCGAYELFRGYTEGDLQRAFRRGDKRVIRKYQRFLEQASLYLTQRVPSSVRCLVSPMLETTLHGLAARRAIEEARSFFSPQCEIVWNPLYFQRDHTADLIEFHGLGKPRRPRCLWSNDGETIPYSEMPLYLTKYSRCEAACIWNQAMNCREDGKFIDPRQRLCNMNGLNKLTNIIRKYQ
jgi:hypothetical protein